jgi:hypothetical protein
MFLFYSTVLEIFVLVWQLVFGFITNLLWAYYGTSKPNESSGWGIASACVTFLGALAPIIYHVKNDEKWPKALEWLFRRNGAPPPRGRRNDRPIKPYRNENGM